MLLMSVSDVVFTMVPDVTNMALPYCECGLSMAKSIPGMLGRMASGPRCVSWMHTTAYWSRWLRLAMSCCFAADSHSTLKDMIVRAGPEKGPFQIQIQNCLFDIICQVIEQHTLCIINVRRLPLRQLVVADMGAT